MLVYPNCQVLATGRGGQWVRTGPGERRVCISGMQIAMVAAVRVVNEVAVVAAFATIAPLMIKFGRQQGCHMKNGIINP